MRHLTTLLNELDELIDWHSEKERLLQDALATIDDELRQLWAAKKRADDAGDVPW